MDAESAEHKGTLAPEHPSLSVVSRAPVSAESGCCAEHSVTDWKLCLWQSSSILWLYVRLKQFLSWQSSNVVSC